MNDEYAFDYCIVCKKLTGLKNGVCAECENNMSKMPDFFSDILDKFNGETEIKK